MSILPYISSKLKKIIEKFNQDPDYNIVRENYHSDISRLEYFFEDYLHAMPLEAVVQHADNIKNGIADVGYPALPMPSMLTARGKIIWDFATDDVKQSRNTFYLYYKGLRQLYFLASAYTISHDESYLQLGCKILDSFYNYFGGDLTQSEMIFNDHAQSERIVNIIFFWDVAKEAGIDIPAYAAVSLIQDALEKLSGEKYYQRNHNHGIIVDRACLCALYFFKADNFSEELEKIIQRLKVQVEYAFAPDGVHKENSIDYHYTVLDLLLISKEICKHIGHPYCEELERTCNEAIEYIVYALKPNLYRPLLGDTKGIIQKYPPPPVKSYGNPYLLYVASQGKDGLMPPELSKYFPSGYYFMREHFTPEKYSESTWLSIRAGFYTRVHKHSDDLSICLYSKGCDIFVDPGMYSYLYGDETKKYFDSLPAHSTVCIKDSFYTFGSSNGWEFKFQKRVQKENYDYVMVSSRAYEDVAIYRHLYYLRNLDTVIIYDECISKNEQCFAQYYHLGSQAIPQTNEPQQIGISLLNTSYSVTVQQLLPPDSFRLLTGEKTSPMSLISVGFNACIDSNTLEYTKTGKSVSFVTVVDIHPSSDHPCVCNLDGNTLCIQKSGKNIELTLDKTIPVFADGVSAFVKDSKTLVIQNKNPSVYKQTVYVFDEDSNNVIKYPYTTESEFDVDLNSIEHAVIVYFVSNRFGETLKYILGEWKNGVFSAPEIPIGPWGCELVMESLSKNKFVFHATTPRQMDLSVSWWIYRNGALYNYKRSKEQKFDAILSEPGSYVIMCSMRNKYFGEFFFSQSDAIVIQ